MTTKKEYKEIFAFAKKVNRANSIIRYNTEFRIIDESVSSHSFLVALIAYKLSLAANAK